MNSLKTLVICAVLAAVAYGVYVSISRNPETASLPDNAPLWSDGPQGQIPAPDAEKAKFPAGNPPAPMAWNDGSASQFSRNPTMSPGGNGAEMNPSAMGAGNASMPSFTPPQTLPTPVDVSTGGPACSHPYSPPPGMQIDSPNSGYASAGSTSASGMPSAYELPGPTPQSASLETFSELMQQVQSKLDQDRLREALQMLTRRYQDSSLSRQQATQIIGLLDQLAGSVIYSREHRLESPYFVRAGDTAEQISQEFGVPWLLVARINGLGDSQQPQPGQMLKVVRGPFHAQIDLDRYELTLMLGDLYAGRFSIGVGSDYSQLEGSYVISNTIQNPKYFGPDNATILADDPANPFGEYWMGLAKELGRPGLIGIHGTHDPTKVGRTGGRGSICLTDREIGDVFGILSVGSRVTISSRRY